MGQSQSCRCGSGTPDQGGEVADIIVQIVRARGLRNADFTSLSDPYVVLKVAGHELHSTRVIDNSLNPVWNEEVLVPKFSTSQRLQFFCYDSDHLGMKGSLGFAELPGSTLASWGFNGELKLEDAGRSELAYLQVKVKRAGAEYPPGPPPLCRLLLTRKSKTEPWGMDLDSQDGVMLFICSVGTKGPVRRYNESVEPWMQLVPGDFIESINSDAGDAMRLLEVLQTTELLTLQVEVRRSCEFHVTSSPAVLMSEDTVTTRRSSGFMEMWRGEAPRSKLKKPHLPGLLLRETPKATSLVVREVLHDWQPLMEEMAVQPLDRIIAVDGVRGSVKNLVAQLQPLEGRKALELTFARPAGAEMPFRVGL